ncbi:MAG: DUF4388 domain-containing protein [bacterium]
MAIKGRLEELSLFDILQLPNFTKKTGLLLVRNRDEVGRVYFKEGEIIHAVLNDLIDQEAIFSLFGWRSGEFELVIGEKSPKETIKMPLQHIILEVVRRHDEQREGKKKESETAPDSEKEKFIEEHILQVINKNNFMKAVGIVNMYGKVVRIIPKEYKSDFDLAAINNLFISIKDIHIKSKRGELNQIFLQDKEGYLVFNKINNDLILVMITSAVANLGVLFLSLKKILDLASQIS